MLIMGYRNRRIACIVVLGGLGILAVICQQWILSARDDSTESQISDDLDVSRNVDAHEIKASSNSAKWLLSSVATKLATELPFSFVVQEEHVVIEDKSQHFRLKSDSNLERVDAVHEPSGQKHTLNVKTTTAMWSQEIKIMDKEPANIDWKQSLTDKQLPRESEDVDSRIKQENNNESNADKIGVSIQDSIDNNADDASLRNASTERANNENLLNGASDSKQGQDTGARGYDGGAGAGVGAGAGAGMYNMDADEFASNVLLEKPQHQLPTKPATLDVAMTASPTSKTTLVNVVCMSLYGSEPRYTFGAIRNAELVRQNFPGWQLWIYMESQSSSRFAPVPQDVIRRLVALGAELHYITPEDDFVPPMMWRFLVADDPSVDRFIVRDVDSRLTRRDAAAVSAWVKSGRAFHCVRDHPSHAGYAVSGGMWGGHASNLRTILRRSWASMMRGIADGYLDDMNFLNNVIWQHLTVERDVYCSDSVSCDRWPGAFPFPVTRRNFEHVGQVYDENDKGRHVDMQILRDTSENQNCIPNHL